MMFVKIYATPFRHSHHLTTLMPADMYHQSNTHEDRGKRQKGTMVNVHLYRTLNQTP
jgi:hypothetical protein